MRAWMWIGGLALGSVVPTAPTPSDDQRLTDLEVEVAALSAALEELKVHAAAQQDDNEETWLVQPGRSGLGGSDMHVGDPFGIRRRLAERRRERGEQAGRTTGLRTPAGRPQPGSR